MPGGITHRTSKFKRRFLLTSGIACCAVYVTPAYGQQLDLAIAYASGLQQNPDAQIVSPAEITAAKGVTDLRVQSPVDRSRMLVALPAHEPAVAVPRAQPVRSQLVRSAVKPQPIKNDDRNLPPGKEREPVDLLRETAFYIRPGQNYSVNSVSNQPAKAIRGNSPDYSAISASGTESSNVTSKEVWPEIALSAPVEEQSYSDEPTATLSVPVIVDETRSANILAEISTKHIVSISANDILKTIEPRLNEEAKIRLRQLGDGLVPVEQIRETGLIVEFNSKALAIEIKIPLELRGKRVFGASEQSIFDGVPTVQPEDFALGVTATFFTQGNFAERTDITSTLGFSGFANFGGSDGINLIYGGDFTIEGNQDLFRRDRVIAFKDDTNNVLRYSAGDLAPIQPRLSGTFDLLGVSVERNYNDLQPTRNIRPIGRSSFLLERRSNVEVYVNGALVRSFTAEAGPIDIRDIPAAELSNNVSIVVEDALGRREIDNFAIGNDFNLLANGINEFSFAAGVLRNNNSTRFKYTDTPVASAFYAQGLTDNLTVGGHAVIGDKYQGAGASAAFSTFGGVAQIEAAGSQTNGIGTGAALSLTYRGDPFGLEESNGQLNFRADYRTRKYQVLSAFNVNDLTKFDLAADYRMDLTDKMSMNVGGSYQSKYGLADRYSLFAGLQRRFGRTNASINGRYSRRSDGRTDIGALFTLTVRLGRRTTAFATVDTATERARFEVRKRRSLNLPEIEYAARAEYGPNDYEVGGEFGFATSRFEIDTGLSQGYERDTNNWRTNGSLRVQSGLAFVDGKIGMGRDPGRGFVMVNRHKSLKPATVSVSTGSAGRELGYANGAGPAVVPILTPHRTQKLRIGTRGAPIGYDIGPGEYAITPGARSGISIEVGSDAYRIATGILKESDGSPLSLKTGSVIRVGDDEKRTFFTNRQGRVVLSGLAPGRYMLVVDESDLQYQFTVTDSSETYIQLGDVVMEAKQ